ncbi:MAG: FtsX-like permease family protein, partial [Bryobacteraceae bacterium]
LASCPNPSPPTIFSDEPYSLGVSIRMTVLIRAGVKPASLIPAVRRAIRATSPDAPITVLAPLDEVVQASLALRRFALELLLVFAILAAVLTGVGVYGVISYTLSQRTQEFAIRFALGAERNQVRNLILRDCAAPAVGGLLAGAWLAYLCAHALRTQLYKLSPADPLVLGASAIGLLFLVLLSALRPVAKAASVSPTAILRQ